MKQKQFPRSARETRCRMLDNLHAYMSSHQIVENYKASFQTWPSYSKNCELDSPTVEPRK
jgi:hypothetical protein